MKYGALIHGCKNEADATGRFIKLLKSKEEDYWFYKIRDIGNTLKPFDLIMISPRGKVCFIEIKFCKTKKLPTIDWTLSKLEPHQYLSLATIAKVSHDKLSAMLLVYHQHSGEFYFYEELNG